MEEHTHDNDVILTGCNAGDPNIVHYFPQTFTFDPFVSKVT